MLTRVRNGECVRAVADDLGVPYQRLANWMNRGFDPWCAAMVRAGVVNLRRRKLAA